MEFAIRSMTSLPAQLLGLRDRGLLREGFWADVVIFDPARIEDRATALDPFAEPAGIDVVLVNGQVLVEKGDVTAALPGQVLVSKRVGEP
jgi:N-acyl-D-aspartate/D-glutamate deacylase